MTNRKENPMTTDPRRPKCSRGIDFTTGITEPIAVCFAGHTFNLDAAHFATPVVTS